MELNNSKKIEKIKANLKKAKDICLNARYSITNKYDPKYFWEISDDLREVETIIENEKIKKITKYFKENYCSCDWMYNADKIETERNLVKLVEKLQDIGTTPLKALNTDTRVRIIPTKILLMYQNIFYYVWQIKELLNIQPNPKDEFKGSGDYRYPNFGYVYSEGERWGKSLITNFKEYKYY